MVRPVAFRYNEQTAVNNTFQEKGFEGDTQESALQEFDSFVKLLIENDVRVEVVYDTIDPPTPDSIFPNNWFSTHEGTLVLYPMFAENRRSERREDIIELIEKKYDVNNIIDLTGWEKRGKFLEGTGSLILDRVNNLAYACKSPRTDEEVMEDFAEKTNFEYILFDAFDSKGNSIYHTNVMMCLGSNIAIICLDAITNIAEREAVIEALEDSGREILEISLEQMENFAGNMLELRNHRGQQLLVMSERAKESLEEEQLEMINRHCKIISPDLSVIEINGGGSARCMIAEIFI
jgi:hypothetical protein